MILVAAYDIRDDGRRSRVAARLQAWGDRVQKSVFVIDIASVDLEHLQAELQGILDLDVDSLYFFRQCGACWPAVQCFGQAEPPRRELFWEAW